jgi:DNA-binding NarL/FixJ family response regulator
MSVESRGAGLRLVIVDDNRHFLRAACNLLEQDGVDVVGVASTSAATVQLAVELRPDVILVDVDLGGESGFDLAQRLAVYPARVVLISAYPESELADLIATTPAVGFVSKSELSASAVTNLLGNNVR